MLQIEEWCESCLWLQVPSTAMIPEMCAAQPYIHCGSTQKQNQHHDNLSIMPWLGFANKVTGIINKNNYTDFNV